MSLETALLIINENKDKIIKKQVVKIKKYSSNRLNTSYNQKIKLI